MAWRKMAATNFLSGTSVPKAMAVQIVEAKGGRVERSTVAEELRPEHLS